VKQKGFTVMSGLAWSGRGKIKRVDVSLDGGRNWRNARIDGPVFDKACVRKPKASRDRSREVFLVGKGFRPN
jgi:sulfane dehydrogenase subunit SoxC